MALLFGANIVRSGVVLTKWASPDCSTSRAKPCVCSMDLSTVIRSGVSVVCRKCVLAQPLKNSTIEIETKQWIGKNLIRVFWSFRVCAHVDYIRWQLWGSILTTPSISDKYRINDVKSLSNRDQHERRDRPVQTIHLQSGG